MPAGRSRLPEVVRRPRRRPPYRWAGRTAVVTGAGSGIGRALVDALAARGCHVALVDVDPVGLEASAARVRAASPRVRVSAHVVDVRDRPAVAALPAQVLAGHGVDAVDVVVNNAGVAATGTFEQLDEATFDRVLDVNLHGVVAVTRAFLPAVRHGDAGRLVFVSSLFGVLAPPGQTAYVASKFAVRGFAASLREELRGTSVGVVTVHPGGVATGIAEHQVLPPGTTEAEREELLERSRQVLTLPPARAAELVLRGVERHRPRVLVGRDARAGVLLERLAPVRHASVVRLVTRGALDPPDDLGVARPQVQ